MIDGRSHCGGPILHARLPSIDGRSQCGAAATIQNTVLETGRSVRQQQQFKTLFWKQVGQLDTTVTASQQARLSS
jgi:hypothetical protein